jgi:predicted dehydrogenase
MTFAMRDYAQDPLRVAMLGLIPGNYHPYSWSAIINGYDPAAMAACPAPVIPQYLGRQPLASVRIPFARVTHVWTDDPADAPPVAAAALIPQVVARPEDVLGAVDAVIIATDDGDDHWRRAAPFIAAGLPVFVDKPLATNVADLARFIACRRAGARLLSSSGLRYAPETAALRGKVWRWLTGTTCKSWRRYGIHILEPLFTLTGPGYRSVRATARGATTLVEAEHASGPLVSMAAIEHGTGSAFVIHGYADDGHHAVEMRDTYAAFRGQLLGFLGYAAGLAPEPYPFADTIELMALVIGALRSAGEDGRRIELAALLAEAEAAVAKVEPVATTQPS